VDTCRGIENYSRHLSRRLAGQAPDCLTNYFPTDDWLLLVDESHIAAAQVKAMYEGDRRRKSTLVEHGFRLPSALDNRPLRADEFWGRAPSCVFVSATPGKFERQLCEEQRKKSSRNRGLQGTDGGTDGSDEGDDANSAIASALSALSTTPKWGKGGGDGGSAGNTVRWWDAEAVIRPTGITDPPVHVRRSRGQVDDLLREVRERTLRRERVLVTTLTKKNAEDLTGFLVAQGVKADFLHSGVKPLRRLEILRNLRRGGQHAQQGIDVLVGVNLLREGLNLPEVCALPPNLHLQTSER